MAHQMLLGHLSSIGRVSPSATSTTPTAPVISARVIRPRHARNTAIRQSTTPTDTPNDRSGFFGPFTTALHAFHKTVVSAFRRTQAGSSRPPRSLRMTVFQRFPDCVGRRADPVEIALAEPPLPVLVHRRQSAGADDGLVLAVVFADVIEGARRGDVRKGAIAVV